MHNVMIKEIEKIYACATNHMYNKIEFYIEILVFG